jgi:hypothetical protein
MKKNLISSRNSLMWILLPLIMLTLQNAAQAQVVFTDSTFNNADWNDALLTPPSVSGAICKASQDPVGNPSSLSRTTTHTYPVGQIDCAHLYRQSIPTSTYDPSTQGEIVSLSYSYDLINKGDLINNVQSAGGVAYSILIFQAGTYYYRLPNDGIAGPTTSNTWTTFSGSNLTAASFTKLVGPSPNVNPDFSCKGSKIVFGYVTRNSNPNSGNTDQTISGIDNWKVSIDKQKPCCGTISEPRVTCDNGVFTYAFTVTNNSTHIIQYLLLSPPVGATFTISPSFINLGTNPLNPGQSTSVSITISNASSGDHICINVSLADKNVVPCCTVQTCVDLPDCPCLGLDISIKSCANGIYTYTVVLKNLTGVPVQQIFIVPTQPSNLNISPQLVTLSTPLQPNQSTTLTITITGAPAGTNVCLRFTPLGDNGATCCSVEKCLVLPSCGPKGDSPEESMARYIGTDFAVIANDNARAAGAIRPRRSRLEQVDSRRE